MVLHRNRWYCNTSHSLYAMTEVSDPITGGLAVPINEIGIAIMVFEVAYIVITGIILVKERRIKLSAKEHLR